jgi:hypothetical protein
MVALKTASSAPSHYSSASLRCSLQPTATQALRSQGIEAIEVRLEESTKGKALLAAPAVVRTKLYNLAVGQNK